MTEAFLVFSVVVNIVLATTLWLTRERAQMFERFSEARAHHRDRVARALIERFLYLAKSHQNDHDKLESLATRTDKQGEAARIMRSGFSGLSRGYKDAADDIQRFVVWEHDATELLEEAEELRR